VYQPAGLWRVSRRKGAALSPVHSLIVEERLRLALATVDSLHRVALFADEPHDIALFSDLKGFATVVVSFSAALDIHLQAVKQALPPTCQNLDAPTPDGARLDAPTRSDFDAAQHVLRRLHDDLQRLAQQERANADERGDDETVLSLASLIDLLRVAANDFATLLASNGGAR